MVVEINTVEPLLFTLEQQEYGLCFKFEEDPSF